MIARAGERCAIAGIALGILGLGAVLCFLFPAILTTPELRAAYPMPLVRALLACVLVASFALGSLAIVLRAHRLGAVALAWPVVSFVLGGAAITVDAPIPKSDYVGLDWFLLNVLAFAVVFVPLERLFAQYKGRAVFRPGFATDLAYFFMSHVLLEVTSFLTFFPARSLFSWARCPPVENAVTAQPVWLQVLEIVVVSDLVVYWVHRAWHRVPFLWRVHAVHHSIEQLDWLAGFRLHVAEAIGTRAVAFVPLFVLGFDQKAIVLYVVFVSVHAVLIHSNVRFRFGRFENVLVTPRYHHWHHAAEPAAIDVNFALHLPVLDRLFGTHHLPPERFPERAGLAGERVPLGYFGQLVHPLRKAISAPARPAPASPTPRGRRSETASRSMHSAPDRGTSTPAA